MHPLPIKVPVRWRAYFGKGLPVDAALVARHPRRDGLGLTRLAQLWYRPELAAPGAAGTTSSSTIQSYPQAGDAVSSA
jgi:hypothetical protein